jgi:hypothetical protein
MGPPPVSSASRLGGERTPEPDSVLFATVTLLAGATGNQPALLGLPLEVPDVLLGDLFE